MCWFSKILIPIKLKKDTIVYKVGRKATSEKFVCKYINYMYTTVNNNKTIQIYPKVGILNISGNIYRIDEGYHSYASTRIAIENDINYLGAAIGVFKIPKDSIIYVNRFGEIVSNQIEYIGVLSPLFIDIPCKESIIKKIQHSSLSSELKEYLIGKL